METQIENDQGKKERKFTSLHRLQWICRVILCLQSFWTKL